METSNATVKIEPVDSDAEAEIYIKKEVDMDYKGDNMVIKEEDMELDDPETERCAPYYNYQGFNLSCVKSEYNCLEDSYDAMEDTENLLPSTPDIKSDLERVFLEQLRKNNYITSDDIDTSQVKVEPAETVESPTNDFDFGFKRIKLNRLSENDSTLESDEYEKTKVKEEDSETGYESSSPETRKTVHYIDFNNYFADHKNVAKTIYLQKPPSVIHSTVVGQNNNIAPEASRNLNLNVPLKTIATSSKQAKYPLILKIPNDKLSVVSPNVFITPQANKNNGLKLIKNNFNGLKLVKLAPNSKIVKIPNIIVPQFNAANQTQSANSENKKFYINLKQVRPMNSAAKVAAVNPTSGSVHASTISSQKLIINTKDNSSLNPNSPIVIESDSEDESKFVGGQNSFLQLSENNTPNREVINDMIKQIKEVENQMNCIGVTSLVQVNNNNPKGIIKKSLSNPNASSEAGTPTSAQNVANSENNETPVVLRKPPEVFFLPVQSKYDPELIRAKREFKDYRFAWLCPHCPREYEQKHAFRGHLVSTHGLCKEEFDKLLVEVKSFDTPKKTVDVDRFKKHMQQIAENQEANNETPTEIKEVDSNPEGKRKKKYRNVQHICNKCGRQCSSKTMLNDHIASNCSREPQYPCPECPKKFFSYSTLTCHITIHTGELPYKCDFCTKKFRTRGQVTVHHRTHTGERPFECQVCTQSFTHRETLISHLSRHIGMKRYKCYGCHKQFSCISGLKMHRDIRPDTCGKVKFNPRALGPRVRVVRGNIIFEPQPEINPYLRSDDPDEIISVNTEEEQIPTQ